jgi:hypothetical protein
MDVMPKPTDGFGFTGVAAVDTMVRRLAPFAFGGDGWGLFEGDMSLRSMLGLTWMWDCEVFLGRPRKKEPKIVVLDGGDSPPALR